MSTSKRTKDSAISERPKGAPPDVPEQVTENPSHTVPIVSCSKTTPSARYSKVSAWSTVLQLLGFDARQVRLKVMYSRYKPSQSHFMNNEHIDQFFTEMVTISSCLCRNVSTNKSRKLLYGSSATDAKETLKSKVLSHYRKISNIGAPDK